MSKRRKTSLSPSDVAPEPTTAKGESVAIVSQGPSAALWPGERGDYAVVIGVNGIPERWDVDLWVFIDWAAFIRWAPVVKGRPKIATLKGNRDRLLKERPDLTALADEFAWSDLPLRPSLSGVGLDWMSKGGTAALGLAWSLKPGRIDCYGCDMGGTLDVFGKPPHILKQRGEERWRKERFVWGRMVGRIESDGIQVRHAKAVDGDGKLDFHEWQVIQPEPVAGISRSWQYENKNGWVTMTFQATSEPEFRAMLVRMIGPVGAAAKVREV